MPSIKTVTPILGSNYYHIFNRGINRQNIFFAPRNYNYFLIQLDKFLGPYISVLAYSLMPNHFHLVIKVNEQIEAKGIPSLQKDGILEDDVEIGKAVSNQFRRFFISYSMAINKQENRTGSLFDKNFKRLEITENEYLKYVIFYTHYNPEKHGIAEKFITYRYSSYQAFIQKKYTKIDKQLVFDIFGGKDAFINYHSVIRDEKGFLNLE